MFENFNKSPRVFVSPLGAMIAILRSVQIHCREYTIDMAKKTLENIGKSPRNSARPARVTDDAEAEARVSAALTRFQKLHLDDNPHTPEMLKILRTPLGFQPN